MRPSGSGKWLERLQYTLLFLVLTVMVHHGLGWVREWLQPMDPYKLPEGGAEKVFQADGDGGARIDWGGRLKLFLWLGE